MLHLLSSENLALYYQPISWDIYCGTFSSAVFWSACDMYVKIASISFQNPLGICSKFDVWAWVLLTLLHDMLIRPLFFLDIWYLCTSLLFNCLKESGEIVCSKKISIRESGNGKKTQDMSQPIQELDVDIMVAWICRAISHNLFVLNCIPKPNAASCQWHIILVACASSCKMIDSPSWNK
jgi:hypothetical protein